MPAAETASGSHRRNTPAVSRTAGPGSLYVCLSISLDRYHLAVVQQTRITKTSQREVRQVWLGMLWSWHCLPRSELGVSMLVAIALCLLMDGAALGTEEGTALFLPGQCLSAAHGQEKDAKSLFPAGEVLQQGGPSPTPTASHRPDGVWLPLGQAEGSLCPLPSCSPWQCAPVQSQVLFAQPPFAILGTLSLVWVDIPGCGTPWELNCLCLHLMAGGSSLTRNT